MPEIDDSNDELNRPARLKTRLKVNDLARSILLDRENASVLWNQIRTFDSLPAVSPPKNPSIVYFGLVSLLVDESLYGHDILRE